MAENDWKAALPDDLKAHESLKDFKDPASLAKSYVETKAMVGNSMRLPGPEASAEERAAFVGKLQERYPDAIYLPKTPEEAAGLEKQIWAKLGRPDDAKGYTLEGLDLGGVELPADKLAAAAAELGMTKGQFQTFARRVAKEQAEAAKVAKEQSDALKKEWGAAYGEKLAGAAAIAAKLGKSEREVEAIKAGRLSLADAKFFDAVAAAVGGSGRQVADQAGAPAKLTPDEAKLRMAEITRNPKYFGGTVGDAEHDALVAQFQRYLTMAHPDLQE